VSNHRVMIVIGNPRDKCAVGPRLQTGFHADLTDRVLRN